MENSQFTPNRSITLRINGINHDFHFQFLEEDFADAAQFAKTSNIQECLGYLFKITRNKSYQQIKTESPQELLLVLVLYVNMTESWKFSSKLGHNHAIVYLDREDNYARMCGTIRVNHKASDSELSDIAKTYVNLWSDRIAEDTADIRKGTYPKPGQPGSNYTAPKKHRK